VPVGGNWNGRFSNILRTVFASKTVGHMAFCLFWFGCGVKHKVIGFDGMSKLIPRAGTGMVFVSGRPRLVWRGCCRVASFEALNLRRLL